MLDATHVAHIARIARLALSPDEAERLAREGDAILAHFEAVLEAGPPSAEPAPTQVVEGRKDAVEGPDAAQAEAIVAEFPRREGRRAKVPGGL